MKTAEYGLNLFLGIIGIIGGYFLSTLDTQNQPVILGILFVIAFVGLIFIIFPSMVSAEMLRFVSIFLPTLIFTFFLLLFMENLPVPELPKTITPISPTQASPIPTFRSGVPVVRIPKTCFYIGLSDSTREALCNEFGCSIDLGNNNSDSPYKEVCVGAFELDQYEVSVELYKNKTFDPNSMPKVYVIWYEAEEFCKIRGGRLPSESEWELAGRGESSVNFIGDTNSNALVSVSDSVLDKSWAGVYGLGSNVREWTSDNGINPDSRIVKGGGYETENPLDLRLSFRSSEYIDSRYSSIGFRCAFDISQE